MTTSTTSQDTRYEFTLVLRHLLHADEGETEISDKEAAARLGEGFSERRVRVLREGGTFKGQTYEEGLLDWGTADEVACRGLKRHPADIWGPLWFEHSLEDLAEESVDEQG